MKTILGWLAVILPFAKIASGTAKQLAEVTHNANILEFANELADIVNRLEMLLTSGAELAKTNGETIESFNVSIVQNKDTKVTLIN